MKQDKLTDLNFFMMIIDSKMVEKKARVSKFENFEFRLENFVLG